MAKIVSVTVVVRDGGSRQIKCDRLNTSAHGGLMLFNDDEIAAEFQPQAWSYYRVERETEAAPKKPADPAKTATISITYGDA